MGEIHFNLVYNRKNKLNRRGEALIQICAYHKGRRKYFSSGIYIKPKQWDSRRSKINSNHEDYEFLNDELDNEIKKIRDVIRYKKSKGEKVSLSKLDKLREYTLDTSFYDFMEKEIENAMIKESTKKTHRRTLLVMREFRRELSMEDLDVSFLMDFERYLNHLNLGVNTTYKYFKNIRTYVNRAIAKDLMKINDYPFKKYKLRQVNGVRDFLNPTELKKLENLDLDQDERLVVARDIFLMSCYTGVRFGDIVKLTKNNFHEVDGKIWLEYKVRKSEIKSDSSTQKKIRIPISDMFSAKPVKIFEKYKDKNKYLFDYFSNSEINKVLKRIEEKLNSGKRLTFHVARHTCATNLLYYEVPVSTIQKILGHDKIETTQVYAKVLDMTIVNDLKNIKF